MRTEFWWETPWKEDILKTEKTMGGNRNIKMDAREMGWEDGRWMELRLISSCRLWC
jgi:hypothetical protein